MMNTRARARGATATDEPRVEQSRRTSVKNLFDIGRQDNQPILSPLGKQAGLADRIRGIGRALPPAAAPIAFTVIGGIGLVVVLSAILGGTPSETVDNVVIAEPQETVAVVPETSTVDQPEEPALDTSLDMADPAPSVLATDMGIDAPDQAQTSSILAVVPTESDLRPSVEIAESEEEIAVLEAIQRQEVEEDIGDVDVQQTSATGVEQPTTAALQSATTNNYVNLRAGPSDDAEVLMVVPANATIEAETDCNWCSVAYDGRQGYIYRTFIAY